MMSEITWHEETRNVSQLEDHPQNPRLFTDRGMEQLTESIRKIGYASPININLSNRILSGHARKKVLLAAGLKDVKVWVPNRELTEAEEREVLLRMNKNIAGEFDFEILANEFEIEELESIGFEGWEMGIDIGPVSGALGDSFAAKLAARSENAGITFTFEREKVERVKSAIKNTSPDECIAVMIEWAMKNA